MVASESKSKDCCDRTCPVRSLLTSFCLSIAFLVIYTVLCLSIDDCKIRGTIKRGDTFNCSPGQIIEACNVALEFKDGIVHILDDSVNSRNDPFELFQHPTIPEASA